MFDTVGVKYVGYDDVQNPRISRLGNPKGHRPKLQKQWSTTLKPTTLKSHPCPSNANPKTESLVSGNTPEPSHERSETMGPYLVEGLAWLLVMSPVIVCILRGSFMCCLFLKAGEGGEERFSSSPSQWLSLVPKPHPHPPPPHSQTPPHRRPSAIEKVLPRFSSCARPSARPPSMSLALLLCCEVTYENLGDTVHCYYTCELKCYSRMCPMCNICCKVPWSYASTNLHNAINPQPLKNEQPNVESP